jgi:predicted cupin superfamily sugar epimerase
MKAEEYIHLLSMQKHPEGGYYTETYRSKNKVQTEIGERSACTVIYFMLVKASFSAFHRLRTDETWYYHTGSAAAVHCIAPDRTLNTITIGPNLKDGEVLQAHIPAGTWFAAEVANQGEFILISCSVSPGFEFEDFELASRKNLSDQFPMHRELIHRLTRLE